MAAVTLVDVMECVTGAHTLVADALGPDLFRLRLQFVEVYALHRTCTRIWSVSHDDVAWLRLWAWLRVRRGPYENGHGCAMRWRWRGWVCPVVFELLRMR